MDHREAPTLSAHPVSGTEDRWDRSVEDTIVKFLRGEPPLPANVRRRAAMTVADVVSAAVAGSAVAEFAGVLQALPIPEGPATFIGLSRSGPAEWAALVNTVQGILEEVEEGHNLGGHVGVTTVMAALAAAEESGGEEMGPRVVDAVARAHEVAARVEYAFMAVRADLNKATEWVIRTPHCPWSVLGAAVASHIARGMGGNASDDVFRDVVRIGLNLATVSMWDPFADGAPARNFTAGLSAQTGVSAARLAGAGVRGSENVVARVLGPARSRYGSDVFDGIFRGLGKEWWILNNYFKMVPACRYTQPPLEALRQMRNRVDPERIESIHIDTFQAALPMAHQRAVNRTSAKFSVPYVVARYLLRGDLELDAFGDAALQDEAVHRLAEKVTLHYAEDLQREFPDRWLARVTVAHEGGPTVIAEAHDALGDWRNPMTEDVLRARWQGLLETRCQPDDARMILDGLLNFDTGQPVDDLMTVLRNGHRSSRN